MTIKSDPIGLIKFGSVRAILGGEMIMSCGDEVLARFLRFLEFLFPWKDIFSGLDVVDIPIEFLFLSTYFSIVLFKFLGWSKAW